MNANAAYFDPSGYYGGTVEPSSGASAEGQDAAECYAYEDSPLPEDYYYQGGSDIPEYPVGSFYPAAVWEAHLSQAPITALAADEHYESVYTASATLSFNRKHRAAALSCHNSQDGSVYSCVAAHPEAPPLVLNAIYQTVFGMKPGVVASTNTIPSHAYKPVYGLVDPSIPDTARGYQASFQMGIQTIIPLQGGYVASVSPSAVRLHHQGGLQVADNHMEGMLCGTAHPNSHGVLTHMAVGGASIRDETSTQLQNNTSTTTQQVICLDVWNGMRIVNSYAIPDRRTTVTTMATNHAKGNLVVGASDGVLRLLDPRMREIAKVRSHGGGVVQVAVAEDGNLLASTGYGSRSAVANGSIFSYPDPTVFLYDVRYLGRGGIPHPFAGLSSGPRHISFMGDGRLMVGSGQSGGGLQIVTPFQDTSNDPNDFIMPQLSRGECITSICIDDDRLLLGTCKGLVHQYVQSQDSINTKTKLHLETPTFSPQLPDLPIEASILLSEDPDSRPGMTERVKSIFSAYALRVEPIVSGLGNLSNPSDTTFGHLATKPMVAPGRLVVSRDVLQNKAHVVDFLASIPIENLGINLMDDHRPAWVQEKTKHKKQEPLENPNKMLYTPILTKMLHDETLNKVRRSVRRHRHSGVNEDFVSGVTLLDLPRRYRLHLRQGFRLASAFFHADYNDTGLLPGFDFPPTLPNAFTAPVLMLLYCIPECRNALLEFQPPDRVLLSSKDKSLTPELGFLFHRIQLLADNGIIYPAALGNSVASRVGAWSPSNFVSSLITMPEAEHLQILDDMPAAVDLPRRSEAFYRFLLYQIDKELAKNSSISPPMERIGAIDFVSINEFISGTSEAESSTTKAVTLDLAYDAFLNRVSKEGSTVSFGEVLRHALSRETRLRAYNPKSKVFETVVQRKVATSLPDMLSISCGCAGRKPEEGLCVWRQKVPGFWLPEELEIAIGDDGSVTVRQLTDATDSSKTKEWIEFTETKSLPTSVSKLIQGLRGTNKAARRRYRLESVLSLIRDDLDRNCPPEIVALEKDDLLGHYTLHTRLSPSVRRQILQRQLSVAQSVLAPDSSTKDTLLDISETPQILKDRIALCERRLAKVEEESEWVLCNGFMVSNTVAEDARAFHVEFKEPSLVVYRAMDETYSTETPSFWNVPPDIIKTLSLSNGSKSPFAPNQRTGTLPGAGDLIAFDAEFVAIQEEDSLLTESGSRVTVREVRHAVARISVLDVRHQAILLDDYVLPREPVQDYLTRFSGIVAKDLNPKLTQHHLISARSAFLKLRCLVERGCIIVGHGLTQDFWTLNLTVPAHQIIDTVEIYHKPAQRYIGLRFLTNYVLGRDMQQDVHDSVEDATAAYELYLRSVQMKEEGTFGKFLDDLYDYGAKIEWKLGHVEEDS